jgi:hypothetical protein
MSLSRLVNTASHFSMAISILRYNKEHLNSISLVADNYEVNLNLPNLR